MLASLHFLSEAVVGDSWIEVATVLTLVTFVAGAYRHIECHQDGCHRLGRFSHGHLKLCHVHHPHIPSDGKVDAEHIHDTTLRLNDTQTLRWKGST